MEEYLTRESVGFDKVNIEHIMPQKSPLRKEWQQMLGVSYSNMHKKWLHTLGVSRGCDVAIKLLFKYFLS